MSNESTKSAAIDNGGSAFPRPRSADPERYNNPETYYAQEGMTLRQYYAGQALQGLMAKYGAAGIDHTDYMAGCAVKRADALIGALKAGAK